MGKHQHQDGPPVTQEDVDEAIASGLAAGILPPQSDELKAAQALLGKAVRVFHGGHMVTVILTDFHQGAYCGVAIRSFKMASEQTPVIEALTGLIAYPDPVRPNSAYQFLSPGSDESILINIAHDDLAATHGGAGVEEPA